MSKLALLVCFLPLTGCAALTASRTSTLSVSSDPPGAEIRVDNAVVSHTPGTVELDKTRPQLVQVGLPGYAPQTCNSRMSPGVGYMVADTVLCVFLFPIGCISFIDAGGAWNDLDQRACFVNLQQGGVPTTGYPQQGYPQQGYPQQGYPQGYPPPPPQGYPPPPPQAVPQGYPPPPPQGYPPPPPQGYPPPQ